MNPNTPKTSSRLVRAAVAERGELERHRDRLIARRDDLRADLDEVERALVEVDERATLLDRLAPPSSAHDAAEKTEAIPPSHASTAEPEVLRGTAIREAAVRLLAQSSDSGRPIHYRRLYQLLEGSGLRVAGKDPLATFLTQLSRSPVMRKTTKAGIYQIDFDAPERLRRRLTQLQTDLRAVTGNSTATDDLADIRRRREQVLGEVAQVERALEEAARTLTSPQGGELARGVA